MSKQLAKERSISINKLQTELEDENNKFDPNIQTINVCKLELEKIWEEKAKGTKVQSKTEWYESGEKSSKYMFGLEKSRGQNKVWNQNKNEKGKIKH